MRPPTHNEMRAVAFAYDELLCWMARLFTGANVPNAPHRLRVYIDAAEKREQDLDRRNTNLRATLVSIARGTHLYDTDSQAARAAVDADDAEIQETTK